mmetsp:Transcript_25394/g.47566  ORF Transcript_25394/g.47566 Transcript_25394/m.47566 type:complete len:161 (+) Transcript_25394:1099-1581(+)
MRKDLMLNMMKHMNMSMITAVNITMKGNMVRTTTIMRTTISSSTVSLRTFPKTKIEKKVGEEARGNLSGRGCFHVRLTKRLGNMIINLEITVYQSISYNLFFKCGAIVTSILAFVYDILSLYYVRYLYCELTGSCVIYVNDTFLSPSFDIFWLLLLGRGV